MLLTRDVGAGANLVVRVLELRPERLDVHLRVRRGVLHARPEVVDRVLSRPAFLPEPRLDLPRRLRSHELPLRLDLRLELPSRRRERLAEGRIRVHLLPRVRLDARLELEPRRLHLRHRRDGGVRELLFDPRDVRVHLSERALRLGAIRVDGGGEIGAGKRRRQLGVLRVEPRRERVDDALERLHAPLHGFALLRHLPLDLRRVRVDGAPRLLRPRVGASLQLLQHLVHAQ